MRLIYFTIYSSSVDGWKSWRCEETDPFPRVEARDVAWDWPCMCSTVLLFGRVETEGLFAEKKFQKYSRNLTISFFWAVSPVMIDLHIDEDSYPNMKHSRNFAGRCTRPLSYFSFAGCLSLEKRACHQRKARSENSKMLFINVSPFTDSDIIYF